MEEEMIVLWFLLLDTNTHIQPKNSLDQRAFQLLIFFIIYNFSYGFIR